MQSESEVFYVNGKEYMAYFGPCEDFISLWNYLAATSQRAEWFNAGDGKWHLARPTTAINVDRSPHMYRIRSDVSERPPHARQGVRSNNSLAPHSLGSGRPSARTR